MKNRAQSVSLHEFLYKILKTKDGMFICFYCGENAIALDHYPPISRVNDYKSLLLETEVFLKVPCCTECNALLSNSLQETMLERINEAKEKIREKYRKALGGKIWDKEEIIKKELSGKLKDYIEAQWKVQEKILARLNFNGGISAYIDYLLEYSKKENDWIKIGQFLVQIMDSGDSLVTTDEGLALALDLEGILDQCFKEAFGEEFVKKCDLCPINM